MFLFPIELDDVDAVGRLSEQPAAEIVRADPEEVIGLGLIAVTDAGQDEEVEALVRFDERVGHPQRVGRVNVVVDVTRGQHQMAFEVLRKIGVLFDGVLELDVLRRTVLAPHLSDALVLFAPRVVVDIVLVVA